MLRLGAYQLLDMTVAPHAATSETVALARAEVGAGGASFANAVLRRVGEKDLATWIAEVAPDREKDPTGHLAVVHSHPRWVVRALSDALAGNGRSRDEIDQLLEAQNQAPAVSLVMRPGLTDLDELIDHGASQGRLVSPPPGPPATPAAWTWSSRPRRRPGRGLPARGPLPRARRRRPRPHRRRPLVDLCSPRREDRPARRASPIDHDADLLAVELQEHRTELVDRAVASLREAGCEITTLTADGTTIGAERPGEFSRVLADVPCSGLGALRRRPEARWRRTPADVGQLGAIQLDLLTSALDATAPGGVVAYVTCSPHLAETRLIVADVLKRRDDVERLDARPAVRAGLLPAVRDEVELGEGPDVQLWPHVHGTDAMFICLLRRLPVPTEEGTPTA